ncbi:MAG: DUF1616 domain-containing protein, partial [Thermoprotei archaeon]
GKLRLEEQQTYDSFTRYLHSAYTLKTWATIAAIAATLALLSVSNGPLIYLRYALGAAFVLYIPGHTLLELLYAKKGELDTLERLALSIGLSLAIVPLVGLILNYTPWGIRLTPIAISLTTLSTALLIAAEKRKHTLYLLAKKAQKTPAKPLTA